MKTFKVSNLLVASHIFIPLLITVVTFFSIERGLFLSYGALSFSVIMLMYLSSKDLILNKGSVFIYVFGFLISLGCWFKYSAYKFFSDISFREPIGNFRLGIDDESKVLWICVIGIASILTSLYIKEITAKCNKISLRNQRQNKNSPIIAILLLGLTISFAIINLKYNILLFALKPEIQLPFKGNVIFFLFFTRAIPFIYLYFCLRSFSLRYIFVGAVIFALTAIGVLSRMGLFIYFIVISILVIRNFHYWSFKQFSLNVCCLASIFTFATYTSVSLSTGAREHFFKQNGVQTQKDKRSTKVDINNILESSLKTDNLKTLKELALGRWIGIEGVMAVESYNGKGFALLLDGLSEKSYNGDSFYNSISSPASKVNSTSKIVSTSVPGPIAFFYYSGSYIFVFMSLLLACLFYIAVELTLNSFFYNLSACTTFMITILLLDFYQFGIAPIAFTKYLFFTLFSVIVFYILMKLIIKLNSKKTKLY